MGIISFHDYKPETLSLRTAVMDGLSRPIKSIPPKFFYDDAGSALFEAICEQEEYYLPGVERRLLQDLAGEISELTGTGRLLIEPGAGSAEKVRLLMDRLKPTAFVPMDISYDFLKQSSTQLANDFSWLPVHAVCIDFTHSLPIPEVAPDSPRLLFFPGSSIGNFTPEEAGKFLQMAGETVGSGGMILIGVDTKKADDRLNAAYNDAAGVTAEFNLNLLRRIRRELHTDLDPERFDHLAFYNSKEGRIEMHLVSREKQTIQVEGETFSMDRGETLHTENSYKYAPQEFIDLGEAHGLRSVRHWTDAESLFAIYLFEAD